MKIVNQLHTCSGSSENMLAHAIGGMLDDLNDEDNVINRIVHIRYSKQYIQGDENYFAFVLIEKTIV